MQSDAKNGQLLKLKAKMGPGRLPWERQTQPGPEMLSQPLTTCSLLAFQNSTNTCRPKSTHGLEPQLAPILNLLYQSTKLSSQAGREKGLEETGLLLGSQCLFSAPWTRNRPEMIHSSATSCVTSVNTLNFSEPLFCNLQSGGNNTYLSGVLRTRIMCMQGCSRSILA